MNRSYSKIRHIQESNLRLEKRFVNEQVDTAVDIGSDVVSLAKNIFSLIWNAKPGMFALSGLAFNIAKEPTNIIEVIKRFVEEYKQTLGSNYNSIMSDLNKIGGDTTKFYEEMKKLIDSYI